MTKPRKPAPSADDGGKKPQLNITLTPEETAALEAFRTSMGATVRTAAAAREAIVQFLMSKGFLKKPIQE